MIEIKTGFTWEGDKAFAMIGKGLDRKMRAVGRHLQTAIKKNISKSVYQSKKGPSKKR